MDSYAGVDWAADKHDVRVCDEAGEGLLAATFAHDEKGLRALCRTLLRLKVQLVAIERPDGLLVERLLDAGLRVLPMHPNQVAAARARFRAAGGKSDRFDAFVLCELARTDSHRFRVLEPDSDETNALRALDPRAAGRRWRTCSAHQPAALGAGALLARTDRPLQLP
jgi:transposase